jgi:hypothetical protein
MSLHTLRHVSLAIAASAILLGDSLGQLAPAVAASDRANVSTTVSTAKLGQTGIQIAQTDRATNQIYAQLRRIRDGMVSRGFRTTHDLFLGNLGRGGDENITFNLRAGTTYTIVGVCDNDCRDLDLELYDGNGNRLAVDRKQDSIPVVSVSPRWNARFTVKAIMPSCANEPCRYGIEAFGK